MTLDAYSRILGPLPTDIAGASLAAGTIATPLGDVLAVAADEGLVLLDFVDRRGLERAVERLRSRLNAVVEADQTGQNECLVAIRNDLTRYFAGVSAKFTTPVRLIGTAFQQTVWRALLEIPAGETRSYGQQAAVIRQPTAVRAVARANGANYLSLIVPCHRVIGADGELTGYGGGLERKAWLLAHERRAFGGRGAGSGSARAASTFCVR